MNYYCGNKKPYVYVYFQRGNEDKVINVLEALNEQGVLFWRAEADNITKKELRRIEAAHSVLLFVVQGRRAPSCSHEMALDGRKDMEHEVRNVRVQNQAGVSLLDSEDTLDDTNFRQIVDRAVEANKNILTIYQKAIPGMSDWAHLQLDSAQAMFRTEYENDHAFIEKLKEAAIFRDMEVTAQQKTFQRRTGIAAVGIPVIAILLIFGFVVYPLLIVPVLLEAETAKGPEIEGLTQEELDDIEEFRIYGDKAVSKDIDSINRYYDDVNGIYVAGIQYSDGEWETIRSKEKGDIEDVSDITLLRNVEEVELAYQNISDISPLFEMDSIKSLRVQYNPVSSIEGISKMANLEELDISATNVTDISETGEMSGLRLLAVSKSPVRELPDLSKMISLSTLNIEESLITEIPYLGKKDSFSLIAYGLPERLQDLSFARDVAHFDILHVENTMDGDIISEIQGKTFGHLCLMGLDIRSISELGDIRFDDDEDSMLDFAGDNTIISLEGIENYPELRTVKLNGCKKITDFTPLRQLPNLTTVSLNYEMMNYAQSQLEGLQIRIEYVQN